MIVNAKSTGQAGEGICFAIPINTAWNIASQLLENGYVAGRPALGVSVKQMQYSHNIFGEYYYQLIVTDTSENSQLKVNDIIYSIDNIEVADLNDIAKIFSNRKIGDKVRVRVRRDKRYVDVEVTLVEHLPS